MKNTTQKIVFTALFTALVCVATMIIKIPSPLKGYLNLGDGVVLLAGWMLPTVNGFLAAGLGSAFADIFLGYALYAPATFLIKGLMALIAQFGFKIFPKKKNEGSARMFSGMIAEAVMVLGYFLFESLLYGFAASAVNIPANAIQGAAGLVLGMLLIKMLKNTRIKENF